MIWYNKVNCQAEQKQPRLVFHYRRSEWLSYLKNTCKARTPSFRCKTIGLWHRQDSLRQWLQVLSLVYWVLTGQLASYFTSWWTYSWGLLSWLALDSKQTHTSRAWRRYSCLGLQLIQWLSWSPGSSSIILSIYSEVENFPWKFYWHETHHFNQIQ